MLKSLFYILAKLLCSGTIAEELLPSGGAVWPRVLMFVFSALSWASAVRVFQMFLGVDI